MERSFTFKDACGNEIKLVVNENAKVSKFCNGIRTLESLDYFRLDTFTGKFEDSTGYGYVLFDCIDFLAKELTELLQEQIEFEVVDKSHDLEVEFRTTDGKVIRLCKNPDDGTVDEYIDGKVAWIEIQRFNVDAHTKRYSDGSRRGFVLDEDFTSVMREVPKLFHEPYRCVIKNARVLELILNFLLSSDQEIQQWQWKVQCLEINSLLYSKQVLNRIHRDIFLQRWPHFRVPRNSNDLDWRKLFESRKDYSYEYAADSFDEASRFVVIEDCGHDYFVDRPKSHPYFDIESYGPFLYRCPLQNAEFQILSPNTNKCNRCKRRVGFAQTAEQARKHAELGKSVTIHVVKIEKRKKKSFLLPVQLRYIGRR